MAVVSGFEPKPEERLAYFERLRERVATLPGVRSASFAQDTLVTGFVGSAQLEMADGSFHQPAAVGFLPADYAETFSARHANSGLSSSRNKA